MGASRKLQGEIDRVLKKVQEGVDIFDSIWNKVYDTDNANQKEKFEADLKKEIKKLQRHRDQIKTWIQFTEIKDKKALMDARKLIEKEMERFKICEKETKTKAFSKEGLGQQPKTDPKEKAKSETRDWLNNTVSELESQIDSFEAEMEGLSVKKGKARPPRLTHLESSINRHKAHIMKLELILRLLDNDELSPEQVNDVKDFLDDYVERNQEAFDDFDDVDMLYNTLPLDKVESLEDLVTICPPGIVKGVGATAAVSSIKSTLSTSAQSSATITSPIQQGDSVQEQVDEVAPPQDTISELGPQTPSPKIIPISPAPPTSERPPATPVAIAGPNPVKGILDNTTLSVPSTPINTSTKEEELSTFPTRKPSSSLRSGVTNLPSLTIPVTSRISVSSSGSLTTPLSEASMSGMMQSLVSPLSSRILLPQVGKTSESVDGGESGEGGGVTGRVFSSPSGVPGIQWRPGIGNPFQSQHEGFCGRAEIAPDQREKFLQRFQQVQQQQQQQAPKQFTPLQFNSQTSGAPLSLPPQIVGPTAMSALQPSLTHSQSGQHILMSTDVGHVKAEELQNDDSAPDSAPVRETDSKVSMSFPSDTVAEPAQAARDIELSPGQPLQSTALALGVIGRRSVSEVGAIGDTLSGGGTFLPLDAPHDQQSTFQLLDSGFYKLPQPKDSERAKSYTPRHPAATPQFYPQVQAPIVNNPAFWERLGSDNIGTDTLFFAFYYQQKSYQQYLAAKELKKQSWRYHKKYNTWFQRHEEPKIATDDYEQGTYVYFDFHMATDTDHHLLQHGWCQRIKTEFKFEYNFLEDELV
ncbi:general negative regulator of transcription subunit 3 isoform X2 [Lactuca sativa]|uniref:general negative regulator of transcription subunit 3 isoform X2 n=1 Tax=Lactuca sativa TaxID=4236 RepID=UPI000CD98B8C|nr:general negative regulator of transcription subunit 3 isoform X2 [Lactuca sativa]